MTEPRKPVAATIFVAGGIFAGALALWVGTLLGAWVEAGLALAGWSAAFGVAGILAAGAGKTLRAKRWAALLEDGGMIASLAGTGLAVGTVISLANAHLILAGQ
ncbi:MAG: hypothetical protein ACQEWM_06055 [Actinomycetota bacterium]